jgi:hypothetical protein
MNSAPRDIENQGFGIRSMILMDEVAAANRSNEGNIE